MYLRVVALVLLLTELFFFITFGLVATVAFFVDFAFGAVVADEVFFVATRGLVA